MQQSNLILSALLLFCSFAVNAEDLNSKGFKDDSEFGSSLVSGNTNSETYNAKQSNTYEWSKDLIKFDATYLESRANGVQSSLDWTTSFRYERLLSELFSIYASYGLESDIFSGYVQRDDSDVGGKYFLAKDPDFHWSVESGYRYSSTHYPMASQPDISSSAVRIYTESTKNFNATTSAKFWIEYIQTVYSAQNGTGNYVASQDYMINAEPSFSLMLNKSLSLKTGYLLKYKNYLPSTSTATKYLDTFFTTSLVAKF